MAEFNFPTPPSRTGDSKTFPGDLTAGERKFYTGISFVQYSPPSGVPGMGGGIKAGGASQIKLPMPKKLNDNEFVIWNEMSFWDIAGYMSGYKSIVGQVAAGLGVVSGRALNPYMALQFVRPHFKDHTLTWTLAPHNQQDSNTLRDIIKECKRAALPPEINGPLIEYPKLAIIKLTAGSGSDYLYEFKPCVILSVQVDYTGGGMPSFMRSGSSSRGAPSIVNLTLQLKEYELQSARDV